MLCPLRVAEQSKGNMGKALSLVDQQNELAAV
jgi:hypothetical protein